MTSILLLLLALATPSEAKKDVCKSTEVTTDAFTGETKTSFRTVNWSVESTAAGAVWTITFKAAGGVDRPLPAGWPVALKLEDGQVVELRADAETPSRLAAGAGGVATQWPVRFSVTPALVRVLAAQPVVAFRFDTGDGAFTWEPPKEELPWVPLAFGCLASKLPAA